MTIFTVHHSTTYQYQNPVRPGRHQLLFRPRDSFHQRLLSYRLAVSPEAVETRWIHDAFGNCLTLLDFNTRTTLLRFETEICVDHTPEKAPDFRIEDYAKTHPFNCDKEELPDLLPYIRRHHADAAIDAWLDKFVTRTAPIPTGQLLMTLNEAVAQSFSYKLRSSRGTQTPAETISRQHGTCRDFALLMMEGGAEPRVRGPLRNRLCLCTRPGRPLAAWRWFDPCLVSDLRARIRLGRI